MDTFQFVSREYYKKERIKFWFLTHTLYNTENFCSALLHSSKQSEFHIQWRYLPQTADKTRKGNSINKNSDCIVSPFHLYDFFYYPQQEQSYKIKSIYSKMLTQMTFPSVILCLWRKMVSVVIIFLWFADGNVLTLKIIWQKRLKMCACDGSSLI